MNSGSAVRAQLDDVVQIVVIIESPGGREVNSSIPHPGDAHQGEPHPYARAEQQEQHEQEDGGECDVFHRVTRCFRTFPGRSSNRSRTAPRVLSKGL